MPETITLTKEQFQSFLDKTLLTDFARKALNGLAEQGSDAETTAKDNTAADVDSGAPTLKSAAPPLKPGAAQTVETERQAG